MLEKILLFISKNLISFAPANFSLPMIIFPIEYRPSSDFGGGLFATRALQPGQLVASFDGEFWEWADSVEQLPNEFPDYIRDHTIQYAPGKSRDSTAQGLARYANHSCEPNCGIVNLFEVVAMRPIAAGEQITWDYAMSENNDWFMLCRCGTPKCRRIITGYRNLPPETRQAYAGYVSQWLLDADIPYEGPAQLPAWSDASLKIYPEPRQQMSAHLAS